MDGQGMKRRGIWAAACAAALAAGAAEPLRPTPNYWCTWATQGATLRENLAAGKIRCPVDEDTKSQRDNLNERVLFDETGWANVMYPHVRAGLYLLADAGWDIPEGSASTGDDLSLRGACVPDAGRFPSFRGTPAQRLKAFSDAVKARGWKGLAVWVPCHVYGDKPDWRARLSDDAARRVLAERMAICREAGVDYWKVDWGFRNGAREPAFRRLMTEVRDRVFPGLRLEHCRLPGGPFNGIVIDKKTGAVSGPGRFVGNPLWDGRRGEVAEVMAVSDVFRTYDVIGPFDHVTTLERCAYYSPIAEAARLPVLLNVEDEPLVAMGLGHVVGAMATDWRRGVCVTNDVYTALAWQELAAPFGHDTGATTRTSDEILEDCWTYAAHDCSWYVVAAGKTIVQRAPAVVTRGLPLPEVRAAGPKPFVCGVRHPNGAVALAFLPRVTGGRRAVVCPADVALDAALAPGRPLGLFGRFRSVTLTGGAPEGARIWTRRLSDGARCDVTARCTRNAAGALVIPAEVLEKTPPSVTPYVVLEAVVGAAGDGAQR